MVKKTHLLPVAAEPMSHSLLGVAEWIPQWGPRSEPGRSHLRARQISHATLAGQHPFRTALKPWETIDCWYLLGNQHSRVS